MRRQAARTLAAGTLAALAGSILWALPAEACSCARAGGLGVDAALATGNTVAIVTRPDDGLDYRIEDSVGPAPESALGNESAGGCGHYVAPGALAALIYERRDAAWLVRGCGDAQLGPALQRVLGDPVAAAGGPAIAYAAGPYESGRLAALDAAGRAVAWDRTPGAGEQVVVCPGGKTVVAVGRATGGEYADRLAELTVHDAATLRVLRTVTLGSVTSQRPKAIRCADARANRVDVLLTGRDDESDALDLLTVRGAEKVEKVDAARGRFAAAIGSGFVTLENGGQRVVLVLVRPDGRRTTIADVPEFGAADQFAVSADGRTAAVFGYHHGLERDALLTVDVPSGEVVGEYAPGELFVTGLAWTAAGELLVREAGTVRAFDLGLTRHEQRPLGIDKFSGTFTAVGDAAVVYGQGFRPTVLPPGGGVFAAGSLRLAAAADLVTVPGAEFATGPGAPAADRMPSAAASDGTSWPARLLAVFGGLVALGSAALVVARRRA